MPRSMPIQGGVICSSSFVLGDEAPQRRVKSGQWVEIGREEGKAKREEEGEVGCLMSLLVGGWRVGGGIS